MEIAVMSDIHGNYVALETCVKYALTRNIETFIFLGDYLGELPYPQKTMNMIYSLKDKYRCFFIKGNKEDYWMDYELKGEHGWKETDSTTGSLFYSYSNLTLKDKEFYSQLSITKEIIFPGLLPLTICHGSPYYVKENLIPNDNTYGIMERDPNHYILCGHTHVQQKIEHKGKVVLNVGSVGLSLKAQGKSQFLVLKGTQEAWNYEFISLEYDIDKIIEDLFTSGLNERAPFWCKVTISMLKKGEPSHGEVLQRAISLCKEEKGECIWPNIPEQYWEQAVNEMILGS